MRLESTNTKGAALSVSLALGASFVLALRAQALPDGAPWEAARDQVCPQCHFDAPAVHDSPALEIDGLPQRIEPGARYPLVVRLSDAAMRKAGFLLSAWQEGEPAGRFAAVDARASTKEAQARSTAAGATVGDAGVVEWPLEWTAPQSTQPVRFDLWANAGNDDASPLGDTTHRRAWRVPPGSDKPASEQTASGRGAEEAASGVAAAEKR